MPANPYAVFPRELTPAATRLQLTQQSYCSVTVTRLDVAGALALRFGTAGDPVTARVGQTWLFRKPEELLEFDVLIDSPLNFFEVVVGYAAEGAGLVGGLEI